jgi:Stigma-specific protein, Stig1
MVGTAIPDIMLQYRHTVVQDVQTRVLNASVSTTSRLNGPFSRRIEQPVAPLEIKAHWNKPKIAVKEGQVELSAEVNGGARQVASGRILTLDGEVSVKRNAVYAVDAQGRPYTCVAPPGPQALHMRRLKVTYEGSHWPRLLAKLDPAKEETLLRPVIATQLFGRLARIPLTYMPTSLPIAVPTKKRMATEHLPIVGTLPGIVDRPGSVALGLMLDKTRVPSSTFGSLFPENASYNAAIGISTAGLNTLLTHLCQQDQARGQFQHSRLGQTHWQWHTLTVALLNRTIRIEGALLQQGIRMWIQAELQCWLDDKGIIRCRLLASNIDTLAAETLLTSWAELLRTLLCTPDARKQNQNTQSGEPLTQVFDIPTTTQTVQAVAQELLVINGQLIVYYTLPMSLKTLPLEFAPPKASVTLVQPHIPHQVHQGALVTAKVEARITKDSVRPYDYAWTTGLSQEPEHGSKLTIHTIPPPALQGGQQQLTTAHLKLIDMFGQVSAVQAPVQYIASTSTEQAALARSKRRRLVIVLAAGALTLLAGSGVAAIAFSKRSDPPSDPPCHSDQIKCNGTCVKNDSPNCGQCGNRCVAGTSCVNGHCVCPSGQTNCNGVCVDTKSDPKHCGSCTNVCPEGQTCSGGQCTCFSGQSDCSGTCTNLKSDSNNCGKCGNVCGSGKTCLDSHCEQQPCPSGQAICSGTCTPLQDDPNNCGSCGNVCGSGQTCVHGTCCSACNGVCVDIKADPNNCGSCGHACGSGQTCVNGSCCSACNGVCVDMNTDPNHCGSCATVCPSGQVCSSGQCICSDGRAPCGGTCCASGYSCMNEICCLSGQTNCGGVCVDMNSDPNHCGSCTTVCPSGQVCSSGQCICADGQAPCGESKTCCASGYSCVSGMCCPSGQTPCNGACVDMKNDPNHCGSCTTVCASGQTCSGGQCICADGQAPCGESKTCCASGYSCVSGMCCLSGQTACNGACVDINNDPNHCGSCTTVCPSGQTCSGGQCTCADGQAPCGGTTCCPSGYSCVSGMCCPSGQTACNGACVDINNDPNHCGSCTTVCASGQTCSGGQCICSDGRTPCGGTTCCSSDETCMSGNCCPSRQVCGSMCCPSGYYCYQGACYPEPG